MDIEKEKAKIEEASKDLYVRQKEFDTQLKDFESQKESLNEIKKDLLQKQKEMAQLTAEFKAKNKMLKDVQSKIDELEGANKMADMLQILKEQNEKLEKELKSKGASLDELEQGNHIHSSYLTPHVYKN
jgi:chromosome segregation ATPase